MKIEKTAFDNLNSLGGHFEIDWQHPSLTDAGIFVIAGPTGVGKSTLLDAICYAIYGKTPRQGRLTASCNEIMTHGASHCRAEAWVESGGRRYLFSCEQRRKKTRSRQADPYTAPERAVYELLPSGEAVLLAKGVRAVDELAEGIMKFENFTRCMLLAQGEFARFLKDNAAGRSEALATITGTEIYQRIGEKVQERVAGLKAALREVALHELMPPAQRLELEQSLVQEEAAASSMKQSLARIAREQEWLNSLMQAQEKRQRWERILQKSQQALEAFMKQGGGESIEAAEAALRLRPIEVALHEATTQLTAEQATQAAEEQWFLAHPGQGEQEAAKRASAELAAEEPVLAERLKFLVETVQPLEQKLQAATTRAQENAAAAVKSWAAVESAARAATEAESQQQQAQQEEQKAQAALQQLAADAALTDTLPVIRQRLQDWAACAQAELPLPSADELQQRAGKIVQRRALTYAGGRREELLQHLTRLEHLTRLAARWRVAELRQQETARAEQGAAAVRAQLPPVAGAQEKLAAAQQRADLAYRIQTARQQLDALYQDFCEGKLPCCPCCGSPTPHKRPAATDQALQQAVQERDAAQQECEALMLTHAEAGNKLAETETAHRAAAAAAQEAARDVSAALEELGWQAVPPDLDAQVLLLRESRERMEALDAAEAELAQLLILERHRKALHDALRTMDSPPAALPASMAEARACVEHLAARLQAWRDAGARAEQALLARERARERVTCARQVAAEKQQQAFQTATQATQAAQKEQKLREQLASLWQGATAREEEQRIRTRLAALQSACARSREALHAWQQAQEAHRAILRASQEKLPALQQRQEELATQFATARQQQGLAEAEAYAAAVAAVAQLENLLSVRRSLSQSCSIAEGACRQALQAEQELLEQNLTRDTAEELTARQEADTNRLHQQQELVTTLRSRLLADDTARRINAEIEERQAGTRAELERWQRLYEILGNSRDGFKKYAQRITFNLLLVQANAQLHRLSDRYALVQDAEEELGLRVIDRYQDDLKGRACSNLSGGECFVVSLALALGLSRMAGETRIDTLFLDEGFGSLDEQALEHVLTCLQTLREGGKLIGIISHVDALKERIPSTLTLLPRGSSGLSTLAPHEAVLAEPCSI